MVIRLSFILVLFGFSLLLCQERYFYTGKDYGSEAAYNPVSLILNGSFDVIQLEGSSRKIFEFPYATASGNVFRNLKAPFSSISRYGWKKFFSTEVFPAVFVKKGGQWLPNYQLHLIGGGLTYASLNEWFSYHNYPYPIAFSIASTAAYHYLNEVIENDRYRGETVDPIADLYIFDISGAILFSFDNVKKFFRNDLNLSDWSLQPSINPFDHTLQNNGQYFSIKWKIPYLEKWHLFYYFGMAGMFGLSYKYDDGTAISAAAGLRARKRYVLNDLTNQMTVDMDWDIGFFYDKNNSLLTSLTIDRYIDNMVTLNVYPGMIKFGKFSPGIWATYKKSGRILFGISTTYGTGIGF